jgi:hypothetical protein
LLQFISLYSARSLPRDAESCEGSEEKHRKRCRKDGYLPIARRHRNDLRARLIRVYVIAANCPIMHEVRGLLFYKTMSIVNDGSATNT